MTVKLFGRGIVRENSQGEAIVSSEPISFYGGLNPEDGRIIERGHELEGKKVTGKVLVFPRGKGSTVGSYVIYAMKKRGTAPTAIVNVETEPIIAVGCVLANIPLMDKLNENPVEAINTGDFVKVLAEDGVIEIEKRRFEPK